MKIEEIREKLGPDYRVEEKDGVITVCDIWDGVEFAECLKWNGNLFTSGKIYPLEKNNCNEVRFSNDIGGYCTVRAMINRFKPSTESAYVDQLKQEAKKRFGEIKVGDRFVREFHSSNSEALDFYIHEVEGYRYDSNNDALLENDMWLYHKGKWAKKIEEKVEESNGVRIEVQYWNAEPDDQFNTVDVEFEMRVWKARPFCAGEAAFHLAKCLEEYINKS